MFFLEGMVVFLVFLEGVVVILKAFLEFEEFLIPDSLTEEEFVVTVHLNKDFLSLSLEECLFRVPILCLDSSSLKEEYLIPDSLKDEEIVVAVHVNEECLVRPRVWLNGLY